MMGILAAFGIGVMAGVGLIILSVWVEVARQEMEDR